MLTVSLCPNWLRFPATLTITSSSVSWQNHPMIVSCKQVLPSPRTTGRRSERSVRNSPRLRQKFLIQLRTDCVSIASRRSPATAVEQRPAAPHAQRENLSALTFPSLQEE